MLEKSFVPKDIEDSLYEEWKASGGFAAGGDTSSQPFTVMMPPANITGRLHLGHALTFTLQDVLVRYKRMQGFDTLGQPGVDHAGIATQMVVERQLAEKGESRQEMGRDKFVEKIWEWKDVSGGNIMSQLRKLGASADWKRERFTMDEGLSHAVRKVFVELSKQGLIYRDTRLVNWDPYFKTAISNLEVENKDRDGNLWYIKYPVEGAEGEFITVATSRPETMFGDTCVAVHPEDERYQNLIGKNVVLPLMGRVIPVVADEHSDPEMGSGAVKITPAHDFNDFEVGKRHGVEMINILDESACLNDVVPEGYRGMDRFEARKKVVAELEGMGLIEKIEPIKHTVPFGEKSDVMIEPRLTQQWYVDAKTLAQPALKAVREGDITFHPKQWENTYFEWLENIEPWCISRQIWWGHRVPVWYGPDEKAFVAMDEAEAKANAEAHYGKAVELTRDTDVLDTWFSSALWPFSTLGWPDETPELQRYYPTDVLVTGFDIIFFWVARMIMFGMHFKQDIPFKDVYIHALVRDEKGQKMSKSRGNVIDPLDLIDLYGSDALRFTITTQAAQGRDVRLGEKLVEGNRNFITKLWNASRYAEMNGCTLGSDLDLSALTGGLNRWLVHELMETKARVERAVNAYRFNDASHALYHFTWGTLCDWYVEFSKPILQGDDAAAAEEVKATLSWVLGTLLHMLHPFIPYVTEELWRGLQKDTPNFLMNSDWPKPDYTGETEKNGEAAAAEMSWVIDVITEIRAVRKEFNVSAGANIPTLLHGLSEVNLARLERHKDLIMRLARLASLETTADAHVKGAVSVVIHEATLFLPLAEVIDISAEKARLQKEVKKVEADILQSEKKLGNKGFVDRAPDHVIEEQKRRLNAASKTKQKLESALQKLQDL